MHTEETQRRDDGFVNRAAHKTFVSLIVSRKKRLCGMRTTIDERLTLSSTFALGWPCTFVTLTFHSCGPVITNQPAAYREYTGEENTKEFLTTMHARKLDSKMKLLRLLQMNLDTGKY